LGGNKRGLAWTCFNLFLTHLLSGLWHGAGWNFVLWGVWFGVWMVIVRIVRSFLPDGRMPRRRFFGFLGWLFTYHVCVFSLLFFRATDIESLQAALGSLVRWGGPLPEVIRTLPWQVWTIFGVSYVTAVWPESFNERLLGGWKRLPNLIQGAVLAAALLFFLGVAPPGLSPFIYFQF
jgi:hypothetical protein